MSINKIFLSLLLVLLSSCPIQAQELTQKVDSLIHVLDNTIQDKSKYLAIKRDRLYKMRERLHNTIDLRKRFEILDTLFREYNSFSIDSAVLAANQARALAEQIGEDSYIWRSMLMQSEGAKDLAKYMIALQILDSIPQEAHDAMHEKLIERYSSIYYSLSENTYPASEAQRYRDSLSYYRNILTDLASTPEGRVINHIEYLKSRNQYAEAIDSYHDFLASHPNIEGQQKAVLQYITSEAYLQVGEVDSALVYMLEASINDLKRSDRKYNALPLVAKIMYDRGDLDHSYQYILTALGDIKASNAYSRMTRVLEALPIITTAYEKQQQKIRQKESALQWVLIALILLAVTIVVIVYIENKRLSREGKHLKVKNENLATLKRDADEKNESLASSGRAKDDQIGQLFKLCSEYINFITNEHTALMKIVKTGKMSDIERIVGKIHDPERLARFYAQFDKSMLDIYPDFVDCFNALMQEEYRVSPPDGQLTPELRIFALLRLGINDTGTIAAFLNYSPQTVYNYRFKMHSHAVVDKEEFYEKVRTLCT